VGLNNLVLFSEDSALALAFEKSLVLLGEARLLEAGLLLFPGGLLEIGLILVQEQIIGKSSSSQVLLAEAAALEGGFQKDFSCWLVLVEQWVPVSG
jgi:hypothetical protein